MNRIAFGERDHWGKEKEKYYNIVKRRLNCSHWQHHGVSASHEVLTLLTCIAR